MSEFKGTSGEWKFGGNTVEGVLISAKHPQNRDICTVWAYGDDFLEQQEAKANALLISKAPKMIKKLKHISEQMEISWRRYDNEEDYDLEQIFDDIDLKELDNLIKEATELK